MLHCGLISHSSCHWGLQSLWLWDTHRCPSQSVVRRDLWFYKHVVCHPPLPEITMNNITITWNERFGVLNHQKSNCLFSGLLRLTTKLHITELCAGNSMMTGRFPAQRAYNGKNVSMLWRCQYNESGVDDYVAQHKTPAAYFINYVYSFNDWI